MSYVIAAILSYFCGSIPFGYLVALRHGLDIRTAGSGNIGATNVTRQLGKRVGAIVLLLDLLKGILPVVVAKIATGNSAVEVAAGIAAVVGHMFPIWLRFRGGKGVATGTGVVAVLLPWPALLGLLVWLTVLGATRYVSLASLLAAGSVAAGRLVFAAEPFAPSQRILTLFALLAFTLVVIRHASNIRRLIAGSEPKVSESAAMRCLAKIIHVLSIGLWFGSNVFFSFVAAVLIFKTWEAYGEQPFNERPTWLPLSASFDKAMGTRIAGATVGPIFPFFFLIQGICALLTLVTALGFSRWEPARRVHRVRFWVIMLAALTVAVGWPLAQKTSEVRTLRYDRDEAVAKQADEQFHQLHMISLFLNFGTIGLVTIGTALAAFLPQDSVRTKQE